MEKEQLLKELGFKKKWVWDKSVFWWEKKYKTKIGTFDLAVDEKKGKCLITIGLNLYDLKEVKWSIKNLTKWDDHFTKMKKL